MCRFICARANAWPSARRKSPFNSSGRRFNCSATRRWKTSKPTGWCSTSSRRKDFRCVSAQRFPGRSCTWARVEMKFNYVDYFGRTPSTGYERLIYDCMIGRRHAFPAGRHGRGGLERHHARFWMCGRRCRRAAFPITPPAPGGRRRRTTCWRATGGAGERSNEDSGHRRRRNARQNACHRAKAGTCNLTPGRA